MQPRGSSTGPQAAIEAAAPPQGAAASTTWGLRVPFSGDGDLQGGECLQIRDGGHALGGEHATALQLPVLVLLQQHRAHQAGDGGIVGEDADDAGAAFDLLIHPLQQVGAPDLAPVLLREVAEGQHILPGLVHQLSGFGKALDQRGGQVIPAAEDLAGVLLGEHTAQGSGDHALVGYSFGEGFAYGDALQQVSGEMNATALPDATLKLPADRLGEPHLGVGDPQFDPSEATLFERGKELTPEALSLTVAHLEAQQLSAAIDIDAHGDDHRPRADLLSFAKPALEVSGI